MKNKYETIPESSSEQEPSGVSFGLNELYYKCRLTLYADWNKICFKTIFKGSRTGHSVKVSLWWVTLTIINTRFRFFILE